MLERMLILTLRQSSLLVFTGLLANASVGFAMPVVCESPSCATWSKAEKAIGHPTRDEVLARGSMRRNGGAGQLAKISPREEREFVRNVSLLDRHFGLNKELSSTGDKQESPQPPAACCRWLASQDIRPETWSYENWPSPGESSDDGEFQNRFLTKWIHDYKHGGGWNGGWNHSEHDFDHPKWFFTLLLKKCDLPVPEPGTAALAAVGMGLLALRRCRNR